MKLLHRQEEAHCAAAGEAIFTKDLISRISNRHERVLSEWTTAIKTVCRHSEWLSRRQVMLVSVPLWWWMAMVTMTTLLSREKSRRYEKNISPSCTNRVANFSRNFSVIATRRTSPLKWSQYSQQFSAWEWSSNGWTGTLKTREWKTQEHYVHG